MSDREAFEKLYRKEVNVDATFDRNKNGQYRGAYVQYAWFIWQAAQAQAQAQASDEFVKQLDLISNRNFVLRMENAALKSGLQGSPVAARFGWDGDGYQYIDSGSGSDWMTRKDDAEMLYATPPAAVPEELLASDAPAQYNRQESMAWSHGYDACLKAIAAAREQK